MQYVIIAKDGKDAQALERRMAAREEHIKHFRSGLETNQNILGGALLNDQGDMCGSVMVVEFENREELDEWLKNDPYVTGDVWQDIQILPFRLAGKA
ncbi:MAG: hypothetical protein GC137_09520 [Alphaproteobacteria bacterium]|nr:hypothetical protein [Alphaproteobacteria bacterium]